MGRRGRSAAAAAAAAAAACSSPIPGPSCASPMSPIITIPSPTPSCSSSCSMSGCSSASACCSSTCGRPEIDLTLPHNTLIMETDLDPVRGAIRYGLESLIRIMKETLPYYPASHEQFKRDILAKIEQNILDMVEAEMTYSSTAGIVNEIVDELSIQDNHNLDAVQYSAAVDSIGVMAHQRIAEYQATLTEDQLREHPSFLKIKGQFDKLKAGVEEGTEMENVFSERLDLIDLGTLNDIQDILNDDDIGDIDDVDNVDEVDNVEDVDDVDKDDTDDSDSTDASDDVIPDFDPIVKQPLEDPVRNTQCQHVYGKAAILQLIKKNPNTRCPATGCDNSTFVAASHLTEDAESASDATPPTPSPPPVKAKAKPKPRGRAVKAPRGKPKRGRRRR